jgi:hypothetical protein
MKTLYFIQLIPLFLQFTLIRFTDFGKLINLAASITNNQNTNNLKLTVMKKGFSAIILLAFMVSLQAQNTIPVGFVKADLVLDNGNSLSGYVKENIKKASAVVFVDEAGNNKKQYEGSDIKTISIDTLHFICIRGDFFKVLCAGKLNYLQKASNSSAKPTYNGTEAIFANGTEGKIGDYFIYSDQQLKLLSRNNMDSFISKDLAGCSEAMQQAKASNGNLAKISVAVATFNNYTIQ